MFRLTSSFQSGLRRFFSIRISMTQKRRIITGAVEVRASSSFKGQSLKTRVREFSALLFAESGNAFFFGSVSFRNFLVHTLSSP